MINWVFEGNVIKSIDDVPESAIGFIYKITDITNNKIYFGRKTIRKIGAKKKLTIKEKKLPENKRKTFKYVNSEYKGWLEYTGSCKPLNDNIEKGIKYKKEIVRYCSNKAEMTYFELKYIACSECLERDDCYNNNILGKIFYKN